MTGPQLTTRYSTVDSSATSCPQCATSLSAEARFCFECGASVAADASVPAGVPEPLEEPADTIPLAIEDLEEIRFGEILEIESCVQRDPPESPGEPNLVDLAFSPRIAPPRSLTSAHTQVVGAVCLEIDTDQDESELDPTQDVVRDEPRPEEIELAGSIEVEDAHEDASDEVDIDIGEFDEPAPPPPEPAAEPGTVVAMIPGPSLPYWPAPARGETVIAAAPPEPPPGYARWSA